MLFAYFLGFSFGAIIKLWIVFEADPLYNMAKYMVTCANTFFRTIRSSGIFLAGEAWNKAVQNGMDMNDS